MGVEDGLTGRLPDSVRAIHVAAAIHSRRVSGGRRGLPTVRIRHIPRTIRADSRLLPGGTEDVPTGGFLDVLRSIHAAATTHLPHASDALDDVLTGHLRDCLWTLRAGVPALFTGHHPTSSV